MSSDASVERSTRLVHRELQPAAATLVGSILLLLGLAGFVSPGDQLLGLGVNPLHNLFHAVTGAIGVFVGYHRDGVWADEYNRGMAVIYGLLFLTWVVVPVVTEELLNAGFADAMLHLALALVFGVVALVGTRR